MILSLIEAIGENRELGHHGKLPWHLPADFQRFKAMTRGHTVIMGRKTYESIGRPLPERTNIVITRDQSYMAPGCIVVHSFDEALAKAQGDEVFVIGGAQVYAEAMPRADRLYITHVQGSFEADTFFPEIPMSEWKVMQQEEVPADEKNNYATTFVMYEKIR